MKLLFWKAPLSAQFQGPLANELFDFVIRGRRARPDFFPVDEQSIADSPGSHDAWIERINFLKRHLVFVLCL